SLKDMWSQWWRLDATGRAAYGDDFNKFLRSQQEALSRAKIPWTTPFKSYPEEGPAGAGAGAVQSQGAVPNDVYNQAVLGYYNRPAGNTFRQADSSFQGKSPVNVSGAAAGGSAGQPQTTQPQPTPQSVVSPARNTPAGNPPLDIGPIVAPNELSPEEDSLLELLLLEKSGQLSMEQWLQLQSLIERVPYGDQ
ncbi:MAG: hypothetical protein C4570_04255, partial [Ammonifex sp.]